jgi:hypothetical protein
VRKNNGQTEKVYTTLDAYQAGFLTLRGHIPKLIEERNKVVFAFGLTDKLLRSLSDYNNGALIEASQFAFAIKTLKSQIFSMRRGKE